MKKIIIALGILLLATPLFASTRQKIPLIPTDAAITMTAAKTLTVTGDATISASPYTPSGTDVAVVDGGTGLSTIADGSVLATNAADTLSAITWHSAGTKVLTNASGTISWEAGGAGDITSVGDCADGACFDGTQGTTLTFNNVGGDATIVYDGSTFTFNKFITSSLTGAVTGIASGNALPALSNLASVACNLSLVSDTANTDDLGTEALYWKKLYLASDISFEGATDDAYQTTLTAVDTTVGDKSINIPNASGTIAVSATAPVTLSALGDIGIDNISYTLLADGTDGNLITWDSSGAPALVATGNATEVLTSNGAGAAPTFQAPSGGGTQSKSFMITNPTASADSPTWETPVGITISAVHLLCVGGTNVVGQLWEYDTNGANGSTVDASDITGTAGTTVNDDGSLSNPGIAAGNWVGWKTTSVSGSPTKALVTYDYTNT